MGYPAAGGGGPGGVEQLSGYERNLHADLQRIRIGAVREAGVLPLVLRSGGSLGLEFDGEPVVVEILPVWASGVGLEVADILEDAADAAGRRRRGGQCHGHRRPAF